MPKNSLLVSCIVPIEVKSGAVGSMKSLQVFMHLKQDPVFAVRFLGNLPEYKTILEKESQHQYQLISLPHYLVEYWRVFIDSHELEH